MFTFSKWFLTKKELRLGHREQDQLHQPSPKTPSCNGSFSTKKTVLGTCVFWLKSEVFFPEMANHVVFFFFFSDLNHGIMNDHKWLYQHKNLRNHGFFPVWPPILCDPEHSKTVTNIRNPSKSSQKSRRQSPQIASIWLLDVFYCVTRWQISNPWHGSVSHCWPIQKKE